MTATSVVMFVLLTNLFFQWMHPFAILRFKKQVSARYSAISFIGGVVVFFIFIYGLWWNIYKATTQTEQNLVFGIIITLILFHNSFWSIFYVIKNKKAAVKEYLSVTYTFSANIAVWVALIVDTIRSYKQNEAIITMFQSLEFTNTVPIFETMITVIVLFVIVLLAGYLLVLSIIKTLVTDYNQKYKDKIIGFIDYINSSKFYLLICSLALMFSFFYFAEADVSKLTDINLMVFDKMTSVFHLIASALFIPVVLNLLLSDSLREKVGEKK